MTADAANYRLVCGRLGRAPGNADFRELTAGQVWETRNRNEDSLAFGAWSYLREANQDKRTFVTRLGKRLGARGPRAIHLDQST